MALVQSDIEADDLSGWHLQFLIDASLQVLVQKSLKLFILLVKQACLLDQVLSVDQKLIVIAQRFVECFPDRELLISEDFCH